MVTLLLIEVRRYIRATAAPGVLLVVVLISQGVLDRAAVVLTPAAGRVVAAAWVYALAAVVAWLLRAVVAAALRPRRDRRASERLQILRDRSHAPGHMLVAIQQVPWVGPAGQRIHAVDVTRGTLHDLWLSEAALPVGSFAVLDITTDPIRVIDWLDPRTVVRARRHDALTAARRQWAAVARNATPPDGREWRQQKSSVKPSDSWAGGDHRPERSVPYAGRGVPGGDRASAGRAPEEATRRTGVVTFSRVSLRDAFWCLFPDSRAPRNGVRFVAGFPVSSEGQ